MGRTGLGHAMIGVLGGTFDPIHLGHLRPALDVQQALGLAEVRFVPLKVAVHRSQPVATAVQRLAMLRAAIEGQPGFVVDDRELRRAGPSYSYDTLGSLRDELGRDVPLCLLIGSDAFQEFPTWHRPGDILTLAHLVVMHRPGVDPMNDADLRRWVEPRLTERREDLPQAPGGCVLFQRVTQLDISATVVRDLIARRLSPRFLLPDPVLDTIDREALYRE